MNMHNFIHHLRPNKGLRTLFCQRKCKFHILRQLFKILQRRIIKHAFHLGTSCCNNKVTAAGLSGNFLLRNPPVPAASFPQYRTRPAHRPLQPLTHPGSGSPARLEKSHHSCSRRRIRLWVQNGITFFPDWKWRKSDTDAKQKWRTDR